MIVGPGGMKYGGDIKPKTPKFGGVEKFDLNRPVERNIRRSLQNEAPDVESLDRTRFSNGPQSPTQGVR